MTRINNRLSLLLAGLLPFMPLLRWAMPAFRAAGSPTTTAWILRWAVSIGVCGYDAVSKASSVAISPPLATVGAGYSGTVIYSGSHAGAVLSFSINGYCLGATPVTVAPGLTATYTGGNTASIGGNPTGTTKVPLSVIVSDGANCSGGLSDSESTSLALQPAGSGPTAPSMAVAPASVIAQVGADIILSGGASGVPAPGYYWTQGITPIPGANTNTLLIKSAQLTNAGAYELWATNSQGSVNLGCVLTVAVTPGGNNLATFYTNYAPAAVPLTMSCYMTNESGASDTYQWYINNNATLLGSSASYTAPAKLAIPANSGFFSVTLSSSVGSVIAVKNQPYISYWTFGYVPVVSVPPSSQTVNAGTNVTFSFTLAGGNYPNVFLYQNETNLVGQTNLPTYNPSTNTLTTSISLTVSNVTAASSGNYSFVVTNFWGSTTSSPATLTVSSPLSVTTPSGQTNYAGKNVSLSATATGTSPFHFQWQKNGNNLSDGGNVTGSAANTLSITSATPGNNGNYQLVVTNISGSVTSGVAILSIVPVPSLTAQSGAGSLTLNASGGVVGSSYIVESSTNLGTGAWTPVQTNLVPPGGSISFTAGDNLATPGYFYRLLFP